MLLETLLLIYFSITYRKNIQMIFIQKDESNMTRINT